jgi:ribosomal protein L9
MARLPLLKKNHIDGHVDAATTTAKKVGELHDAHITEIKTQAAEARAQITEATTHFNSGAEHLKQEKLNFSPAAGNSGSKFVTVSENAFKEKKFWDATKTRMSANYEKSNLLEKGVRGTGALIGSYIGFKNGLAIFLAYP